MMTVRTDAGRREASAGSEYLMNKQTRNKKQTAFGQGTHNNINADLGKKQRK
jgi:hypothetical protein